MNRKERRKERSIRKKTPVPASIDAVFAEAVRHHEAGRLAEAEIRYRKILRTDRNHADSLHLLGVSACQSRHHDSAVELISRAIQLKPQIGLYHGNLGLALKGQGKLDAAMTSYRRAVDLDPRYAEAHNNLANALNEQGKHREAVESFERAIALGAGRAEFHYNLGTALSALGDLEGASSSYETSLALRPDYAEAHYNLANTRRDQGRLDAAVASYQRAVSCNPRLAEAYSNLGCVLSEQGKLDAAVASHEQAVSLKSDSAEVHNNFGNTLRSQGLLEAAEASYERALALNKDFAEAHYNLGLLFSDKGTPGAAITRYERALAIKPHYADAWSGLGYALMAGGKTFEAMVAADKALQSGDALKAKILFADCLRQIDVSSIPDNMREHVSRALSEAWMLPRELAYAVTRLIKRAPDIAALVGQTGPKKMSELSDQPLLDAFGCLANNQLLVCLLKSTPNCDVQLEHLLTACRSTLLKMALESPTLELPERLLAFAGALAEQCFINEYVFSLSQDEMRLADQLKAEVQKAIDWALPLSAVRLVALAAYSPLGSLHESARLLERPWPACVAALLELQIAQPNWERQHGPEIQTLTSIESSPLRSQYEENPYPRWLKAPLVPRWSSVDHFIRGQFPNSAHCPIEVDKPDILVAGCGTGLHAILLARRFPTAKVLAIDLSHASLRYAARQTDGLGLKNVHYAQADLMQLGAIGRQFDVIESVGVLHHLEDPQAGLKVLVSLLRPNGLLKLGLYSQRARQPIAGIRRYIAESGYQPTAQDIRRCRQDLMALSDGNTYRSVVTSGDFASTSGCRDLLFHVQEHTLTLPEIAEWLRHFDLRFLGFELGLESRRRFKSRYPDPVAEIDLAAWHDVEEQNPQTFIGMYQFWVQKAATAR